MFLYKNSTIGFHSTIVFVTKRKNLESSMVTIFSKYFVKSATTDSFEYYPSANGIIGKHFFVI